MGKTLAVAGVLVMVVVIQAFSSPGPQKEIGADSFLALCSKLIRLENTWFIFFSYGVEEEMQ